MTEAARIVFGAIARGLAPREQLTVSEWADRYRKLSNKESPYPGDFRTDRNPIVREIQDCFSKGSRVHDVVIKGPVQSAKTTIAQNVIAYTIAHDPAPIMVCLPAEVPMVKWGQQKLAPMLDETPAVKRALTSTATRDGANTRTFKDFEGGQLYLEHAGSTVRLKLTSVRTLIVDETDDFEDMPQGDDPLDMLEGRTSAYRTTAKRLWMGVPALLGTSRIDARYEASDKRRYYVPCPHCAHEQPLEWSGLQWAADATSCWYVCRSCGACFDDTHKTRAIARGRWVAENPEARARGYHWNALYYPIGLGPRWIDLVHMWLAAQGDPTKLKTFINERLAETWEDPAMRAVKHNVLIDRAEPYPLRVAPVGVLAVTAGTDTQDNRLAVHIVGWGRGLRSWTLDYVELPGDPADDSVWLALTQLLNRPIEHSAGGLMQVEAFAVDAGGHRTEAVKNFIRSTTLRRAMCIFGAIPNNAPLLSPPKLQDVTWQGKLDKRGVRIYHVGTVAAKHHLYSRISKDAEKPVEGRFVHLPNELPTEFFTGLVSETYNPSKNRFELKKGLRNEPLDTWVYAYAAAHHPELRLHRASNADWDARERYLERQATAAAAPVPVAPQKSSASRETSQSSRFGSAEWRSRR